MTRDTSALVAAARAGDKSAFGVLAERYYPMAHAACARFLGDADRALDVTQEAVVTAMLSLDRLRHDERFGAWLTGIALNVCRRLVAGGDRSSFSLDALLGTGAIAEPRDGGVRPDDAAVAADIARRVRDAIAALPAGQRAAAESYYLSGLATAEVAASLGIPAGAAKTRLHKARAALRASLADLRPERRTAMPPSQPGTTMVGVTIGHVLISGPALRDRPALAVAEAPPARTVPDHYMVLTETGGDRTLYIGVGEAEAIALALTQGGREFPRPMTYQFAASLLASSGTGMREVRITSLADGIFYAQAVLTNGKIVDARPSDAINLAAITGAPVLAASELLDLPTGPRHSDDPAPPR